MALWEGYLDQEKQRFLSLNSEIAVVEAQINSAVYRLFGLTEEEIEFMDRL